MHAERKNARKGMLCLILIVLLHTKGLANGICDLLVLELFKSGLVMLRSLLQDMLLEQIDRCMIETKKKKKPIRIKSSSSEYLLDTNLYPACLQQKIS